MTIAPKRSLAPIYDKGHYHILLPFLFEGSISKLPVVIAKEKPARALIGLSLPHRKRFYEFFTVPIRNKNTKRSYEPLDAAAYDNVLRGAIRF